MRPGEVEGDHYHFISKEEFEEKIRKGDFYEYDLHHGNYYGTSRELMNNKIKEGKIIVKDIEVNGTENLLKILGNDTRIVTIFLKVGKEELKRRLIERGDNIQDIEVRLGRLEYEEDKIISKDILIYICNDAFNFLYSALVDFPNCACPKCSCHEYISDKCRGEHFVRSRYAPAHYSNHVENISDFYTLLRRYIGIVFILLFQRHNHSDFIALKIRKSNVEIGARRKSDCIVKG